MSTMPVVERVVAHNDTETVLRARTPGGGRIFALDALRGLAAFVVVWHHFREAFDMSMPRWYLRPLLAGHAAVVLFFVLSGYVLSIPYWNGRSMPYGRYLLRRFFRIYVPYAGAVVVAVLVASRLLGAQLPLTQWFYNTWHTPLTAGLVLRQFLTISVSPEINTAFWSLRYEMEMSIVFPLVCWVLIRMPSWTGVLLALAIEKTGYMLLVHSRLGYWQIWSDTLIYASCFLFGALLARERDVVGRWYGRTPQWGKVVLLVLAVVGYSCGRDSVLPFAACLAIMFARYSRAARWLDTPVPEYLGRISYSMYLLHATVLWAVLILLYGKVPLVVLGAVYAGVTFAVSHLFCVGVEEPAMRWGKRLTTVARG